MNPPDEKQRKKTLYAFSFSALLNDLGSDMLQPVWPVFVTQIVGAPAWFLGLLDGVGNGIVFFVQFVSGFWSDRIGKRKPFIWMGYALAGLGRVGYALASSAAMLLPAKILDRMGKMRDAPRDAVIADNFDNHVRGRAFGLLSAFDNAGAICGILASFFLLQFLDIRTIILIAAVPSVVAALLVLFAIRESTISSKQPNNVARLFNVSTLLDRNLAVFFLSVFLISVSVFSFSFLLLAAQKIGFPITALPLLYLLFTAVAAISSVPFGRLADRFGSKRSLAASYALWVLACLVFLFSPIFGFLPLVFGFALYGLHLGSYSPSLRALTSDLAPEDRRASVFGIRSLVLGVGSLFASLVAGILWDTLGFRFAFGLSLITGLAALGALVFVKTKI